MSRAVRFLSIARRHYSRIDGAEYDLSFELGTISGNQFTVIKPFSLVVQVSGTLEAIWHLQPDELARVVAALALPRAVDLAREGALDSIDPIKLNTYSAPHEPPPVRLSQGTIHSLGQSAPPAPSHASSFLSEDISEVRDQINALAKSLWGERVLLLSQERPLLDMYKEAANQTDFRARVQSLGIIAKDVNRPLLAKVGGVADYSSTGDFILLDKALQSIADPESISSVSSVLKQVNALRQGYPAHGDNAEKFLAAHRFFDLPYPIGDYSAAWERILGRYFGAMKSMRDLLSEAWRRAGQSQ